MQPRPLLLKNGSHAVLRPAAPEDAARMLDYLRTCAAETDFLLRYPEEWEIPVEKETALLREMAHNRDTMMLVCEADGIVAGTCQVMVMGRSRRDTVPPSPSRCAGHIGALASRAPCLRRWRPLRARWA